jgi:predicted nucleotide-binding protein (sugar kinase/HSP70/actin superfamily)
MNKNFEKYEKSEKLINEMLSQISNVKTSNIKYQSDFHKNMNEFDEKLMNIEILIDQQDKQDKILQKKLDSMQMDIKRKETNLLENYETSNNVFNDKLLNVKNYY